MQKIIWKPKNSPTLLYSISSVTNKDICNKDLPVDFEGTLYNSVQCLQYTVDTAEYKS